MLAGGGGGWVSTRNNEEKNKLFKKKSNYLKVTKSRWKTVLKCFWTFLTKSENFEILSSDHDLPPLKVIFEKNAFKDLGPTGISEGRPIGRCKMNGVEGRARARTMSM